MKPVMFCTKTSGMPRIPHSWMKCVALSADSENSTPLLATMPTSSPWTWAKPVTMVGAYRRLNSSNREPSTRRASTSRTSYCRRGSAFTIP